MHRENDYTDYMKFRYVGLDGRLHTKPSANPSTKSQCYGKMKKRRIGAPRTVGIKNRNNVKRVRHVELMGQKSMQEQQRVQRPRKSETKTERAELPIISPRIERLHRQVADLQDTYHLAQMKVNQFSREHQLRVNKPEHVRHCQAIWKELCDKIDDVEWKQKRYERENASLQRMVHRRTFTRVERAFGATATSHETSVGSAPANDVSQSFDQCSKSKIPIKLSTKAKLRQMKAMLRQLKDEVKGDFYDDSSTDAWRTWDDSMTTTQHEKSKSETKDTTETETNNVAKPAAITTVHEPKSLPAAAIGEISPWNFREKQY